MGGVVEQRFGSAVVSTARGPHAVPRPAIAVGGLALATGAFVLTATSDHLLDPVLLGVEAAVLIVGSVAAALLWADRPPGNRIALLLGVHALVVAGVALQGAGDEILHSLGTAFDPLVFFVAYLVVFAFPDGRLHGRAERLILGGLAIYLLVRFVRPANGLMLADRPDLAAPFGSVMTWAVIVLLSAVGVCLLGRLATASRPRRRTLLPVYIPALALTVAVLVLHGFAAGVIDLRPGTVSAAGWAVVAGRVALAFGFLLAIAQAGYFAGSALKRLVEEIGGHAGARRLRAAVADALDDPSAELAFRVDDTEAFVTSRGKPVAADPGDGRASSRVERRGVTAAVIWHDPALSTDPELIRAACLALTLALDNDRLEHERQTSHAELVALQARLVAVGEAGRRKIERDLHDGAQQHLIALRIKVEIARELAETDTEVAARLADVAFELDDVLRELRDLAHGVSAPVLGDLGLGAALSAVARRSASPVVLDVDTVGRYAEEVETAVYFCCLESLQNVLKHAGDDARAKVSLAEGGGELRFVVADDGIGCDMASRRNGGSGLDNMRDRVGALGGSLIIESAVGRGTRVRGRIPLAGRG